MKLPANSFLVTVAICSAISLSCDPAENARPPNILFFIADDMYPEMFNFLLEGEGKNLTPNLDRLASEGTILQNQFVASPVCTPSRYNCLTGRYASRASNEQFLRMTEASEGQTVVRWNTFVTEKDSILPQYLRKHGYATGMVGKNHVIGVNGLHRFPDYYADPTVPDVKTNVKENYRKVKESVIRSGFDYAGGLYNNNPDFIGLDQLAVHNLDWITEAGLDFIEMNCGRPFFLYFATTVPHGPSSPARSWNADPKITANGILEEAPGVLPPRHTLPERLRSAGITNPAMTNLLWLDDALGALLGKLEELQILDHTIIIFFNDHGQHAKGTLYQGGIHDPSVVWTRGGFPCGMNCSTRVSNIDFAPTILEMAGIPEVQGRFDGTSFLELLNGGEEPAPRTLFFELGYGRAVLKGKYKYYAIRYPGYALDWSEEQKRQVLERYNNQRTSMGMNVVNRDPSRPFSHLEVVPGGGAAEHESYGVKSCYFDPDQLFDLEADPGELHNLAGDPEYQSVLQEMREVLKNHLEDLPGHFDL